MNALLSALLPSVIKCGMKMNHALDTGHVSFLVGAIVCVINKEGACVL